MVEELTCLLKQLPEELSRFTSSKRINRICTEALERQETEPALHQRRDGQKLQWLRNG